MLVLRALLVIFLVCVSLFVNARPRRIEDMRELDGVQKIVTGDTGIGQGYNRQRMEASPNTHLTLPSILHAIPVIEPTNYTKLSKKITRQSRRFSKLKPV